jgi:hypothetical protein
LQDIPLGALFGALFILFLLSAFFSGSETALMSLNRYRMRHKAKQGHKRRPSGRASAGASGPAARPDPARQQPGEHPDHPDRDLHRLAPVRRCWSGDRNGRADAGPADLWGDRAKNRRRSACRTHRLPGCVDPYRPAAGRAATGLRGQSARQRGAAAVRHPAGREAACGADCGRVALRGRGGRRADPGEAPADADQPAGSGTRHRRGHHDPAQRDRGPGSEGGLERRVVLRHFKWI